MPIATFQGVVENGRVRLASSVNLPEKATVYVVVPDEDEKSTKSKFNIAEMISQMPPDFRATEEGFGPPVGKEEW